MPNIVREPLGDGDGIVVGDRPDTDGKLADRLGYRFALVLTGVITAEQVASVDPKPDEVAADLATLVDVYGTRG
jgi:ribonucleotide monophosphatase NagD (HAD superfamily)